MARSESRTKVSIWSDADFLALTKDAQRAFWMLYSQPTITLCGVLALTIGRWAKSARDETPESLEAALEELAAGGFIVLDRDTEEVWIRTFVHHDGVARSSKTLAAAQQQVGMIASATIREGVKSVFSRLANGGDAPESAKPLENRVSVEPEIPYIENQDRPRVRAHAVSCLQSPSPSPRAPDPDDDSGGITPDVASLPARRERLEAYEADFDIAWEPYPRKVERKAALRAYVATRRRGADPVELLKAVQHYAEVCRCRAPAHIKHGSTFFGPDEPWIDYVTAVPSADSPLPSASSNGAAHPEPTW